MFKSCELFVNNPNKTSYVAINPLATVSTCELAFDVTRLTETDDEKLFTKQRLS